MPEITLKFRTRLTLLSDLNFISLRNKGLTLLVGASGLIEIKHSFRLSFQSFHKTARSEITREINRSRLRLFVLSKT